jgi:pimeloyl-ACP methyl ester carboxylesterase
MVDFAFIHGGGQGAWAWAHTIVALDRQTAGGFGRAIALDAPGCGTKRGRPTDGLTLENVAHELIADIEAAGLRDVVIVGHSQGGQAMAFMLAIKPALFRRAIYVTCSLPLPGQTVIEMMGTGPHGRSDTEVGWPDVPIDGMTPERRAELFTGEIDMDTAHPFAQQLGKDMWPLQTYRETDWRTDHLGAVPASYVLCLRDRMLPLAWQERFAERFGAERLVRIDAGHQAMNTHPHGLAEILRREAAA